MVPHRFIVMLGLVFIASLATSAHATPTRTQPQTAAARNASRPSPKETVLWSFDGPDGNDPFGSLIADTSGAFYGVTNYGGSYTSGTVYKLTPSAKGYTESVLWSFGNGQDGSLPFAGLISDTHGALYGTTLAGGATNSGAVFKLTPSPSGYAESILYSFCPDPGCVDGNSPGAGLTADAKGDLYGTTEYGGAHNLGAVFKLTPSGSGYTERVIHSFCAKPTCDDGFLASSVSVDALGALYGVTQDGGTGSCSGISGPTGCGVVFKLVPSGSTYTERVLWSFGTKVGDGIYPSAGLIADATGSLYGSTSGGGAYCEGSHSGGCGTVFRLTPAGQKYTERVIWSFDGTDGDGAYALVAGKNGVFYGLTSPSARGSVFRLTPSGKSYREHLLWTFGASPDGWAPVGLIEVNGALYGSTESGGDECGQDGCGTVFRLKL